MAKYTRPVPKAVRGLSPHEVIRKYEGKKYFGYERSRIKELIKKKVIPPTSPVGPGARAQIWTGAQILTFYGIKYDE